MPDLANSTCEETKSKEEMKPNRIKWRNYYYCTQGKTHLGSTLWESREEAEQGWKDAEYGALQLIRAGALDVIFECLTSTMKFSEYSSHIQVPEII